MDALQRLIDADAVVRLKNRDPLLFSDDVDARQPIIQRLGWTDLASAAIGRIPLVENLARALVAEGATDIVLLGMGGSSLAPLVISRVIGPSEGMPRLHVLDTTSPVVVRKLLDELDPASTFFLVSSKSGTTIEPLSLYAVFREWMDANFERPAAGQHFIAVTDPGTPLEKMRQKQVMRVALSAPATVGGRFSALSMFGLAPAGLIGVDLKQLIDTARTMQDACHAPAEENPGAQLAAWMVDGYESGHDKLTVIASPEYRSFGLWIEQLVAESTGKNGEGIVPVLEHSMDPRRVFGDDRAFVVIRRPDDAHLINFVLERRDTCRLMEYEVGAPLDIGAEFVRWEYAVALVGHLMGINPFDEPNVGQAKEATARVLAGTAAAPRAIADVDGVWVTYAGPLEDAVAPTNLHEALHPLASAMRPDDYLALLAYLPDDEALFAPLRAAATTLSSARQTAVCVEMGPRYLHSTGQLHKGGRDNGLFLVITARDRVDVHIPGADMTLGQLFRAQAEGDLVTLAAHGRRVMRFDLPDSTPESVARLAAAIQSLA
ncbi:MAG: glucose-6-phosphate isomerase [Actinomycetota bacterium]|nr:glucose-6-phosphate isomerase [Actinomycetota bacterium]